MNRLQPAISSRSAQAILSRSAPAIPLSSPAASHLHAPGPPPAAGDPPLPPPLLDFLITGVVCSCSPPPLHTGTLLQASSSIAGAPARVADFRRSCSCPSLQARELPPPSLCSNHIVAPSPFSVQRLPGRAQLSGCFGWQVDEESQSSALQQCWQLWKLVPNPTCPPAQRLPGHRGDPPSAFHSP